MRSSLSKPTKAALEKECRARFPDFKKVAKSGLRGDLLFQKREKGHSLYFCFSIHESDDTFTATIAGSVKHRYPFTLHWSPAWFEKKEPIYTIKRSAPREEFSIRLGEFWTRQDIWWPVTSFTLPDVRDQEAIRRYLFDPSVQAGIKPDRLGESIAEVMQKLAEYATPYFEAYAAALAKYGAKARPKGEYPELDDMDGR